MAGLDEVYLDLDLPSHQPFQVTGFGENAVDMVCTVPTFPQFDSKLRMDSMVRLGGGTIATACALCGRYGLRTRYVGRVGDDEAGKFSKEDLEKEPLDLVLEVVPQARSHFSLIISDRSTGSRTILWDRDERIDYGKGELQLGKLLETQVLMLDASDPGASLLVAEEARSRGIITVLDVDRVTNESEALLSLVEIAVPSRGFVRDFTGVSDWREGLEQVSHLCSRVVVVTLGDEGAAVIWNDRISHFPPFPVEVLDSTAAGDVFHGAFVFGCVQGWSLGRCMKFANAAGALACRRMGARPSIPSLQDVLRTEERG